MTPGYKKEFIIFALVAVAMAAIIWWQRHPKYSWKEDLEYRLDVDFNKTREEVTAYIKQYIPEVTEEQIDAWTASGKLEAMERHGEIRYFKRAARNLFRLDTAAMRRFEAVEGTPGPLDNHSGVDAVNLPQIIADVKATGNPIAQPRRMRVKFTLTVEADAVPAGKTIRCWLPYPRSDVPRQTDIRFIEAGPNGEKGIFSGNASRHSTLYLEATAVAGQPTVFHEAFEYTSAGEWHDLSKADIKPYDTTTALYKEFTAEREKHIVFTDRIKALADSLTQGIDNPYEQAKALFTYIDPAFPWASAREYSTLENIPEYVLSSGHGDCGMVTLLLLTMCRYKGIPCHFQSGFMMHPGDWNMHDWGELYFEGVGWVPVDMSFGFPPFATGDYLAANPDTKYFYLGGIDSYRMVVNSDFGCDLVPRKKFPRSETVDFQRGEVEWEGGNLYYPSWDWHLDIEYLN